MIDKIYMFSYYFLYIFRKSRKIEVVLFAMLVTHHNGTVIQNQDTIYVLLVTISNKEWKN